MTGVLLRTWKKINVYKRRWKDIIKICLTGTGWEGMHWINPAHGRDNWGGGSSEHNNEHLCSIIFCKFSDYL